MNNDSVPEKSTKSKKLIAWIIFLLIVVSIAVGAVICWKSFFNNSPVLTPDFAPEQEEKYAENIGDNGDAKLPQPEGGGAVSLTYSTNVDVDLDKNKAYLFFGNPTKSNQDMLLQIVVQDNIIAQSGKLVPGKQVYKLDLLKDAASKLTSGGYNGKFIILYYQKDTGEKTVVNTEIPVTINVNV